MQVFRKRYSSKSLNAQPVEFYSFLHNAVCVYDVIRLLSFCYMSVDIDECIENGPLCGAGSCLNTKGSYRCVCPDGYVLMEGETDCMGQYSI